MKQKSDIELRSEKALNIVGRVPSVIIRYGIIAIILSICSIIIILSIIPYRENIYITMDIHKSREFDLVNSPASGFFIAEGFPNYASMGQAIGFVTSGDSLIEIQPSISGKLFPKVNIGDSVSIHSVLCGILAGGNGIIYGESVISAEIKAKINYGSTVTFSYLDQPILGYTSEVYPIENTRNYTLKINFGDGIPLEINDLQTSGHVEVQYKSILNKFMSAFRRE